MSEPARKKSRRVANLNPCSRIWMIHAREDIFGRRTSMSMGVMGAGPIPADFFKMLRRAVGDISRHCDVIDMTRPYRTPDPNVYIEWHKGGRVVNDMSYDHEEEEEEEGGGAAIQTQWAAGTPTHMAGGTQVIDGETVIQTQWETQIEETQMESPETQEMDEDEDPFYLPPNPNCPSL
jgi:hypothetical protein